MGVDLFPDERLVARVRAGDMRAFEAIYDRYERPIHTFCRHLLGQPDDADDAVQHTFLAAYRTITGSDRRLDLKPWLFTVARNRCRSLLRSRRRDPCVTGEAFEPSTEGLAAAVERRESLRHMLADIAALPEEQRAALILTQLETLKHDEVARVLEVPADKVKALVFQARTSLMHAREARDTACGDIREQLATLSGPALRRGNLKRHLRMCTGCRDFEVALRRQHSVILLLLPVAAHPALRTKVLGEIAGGGSGAAAAGAGAGAGSTAGGLVAKGAALKLAAVAAVTAAGAGVGVAGPGTVAALARDALHVDSGGNRAAAWVGDQAYVDGGTRTVSLRSGDRRTTGDGSAGSPGSTSPTSHDHASPGGGGSPARQHSAVTPLSLGEASNGGGGGSQQPAPGGGKPDSPPGLAGSGGRPPGLGKRGSTPPGLGKQGGTPPGLGKKPSSTSPGTSGGKGGSSAPPGPDKTPASTGSPAAGAGPGGPPAGAGPPDSPGPASGNGGGNGNSGSSGGGNGHRSGHGGGS